MKLKKICSMIVLLWFVGLMVVELIKLYTQAQLNPVVVIGGLTSVIILGTWLAFSIWLD